MPNEKLHVLRALTTRRAQMVEIRKRFVAPPEFATKLRLMLALQCA